MSLWMVSFIWLVSGVWILWIQQSERGWLPFLLFLFNSAKQFNQNVWLIAAEWRKERKNGPAHQAQQQQHQQTNSRNQNYFDLLIGVDELDCSLGCLHFIHQQSKDFWIVDWIPLGEEKKSTLLSLFDSFMRIKERELTFLPLIAFISSTTINQSNQSIFEKMIEFDDWSCWWRWLRMRISGL